MAEGLAEDVAEGWPEENPKGGLQSTPRAQIEFSRDRPRAQIHLATPEAFPQIVILSKSRRSCVGFHFCPPEPMLALGHSEVNLSGVAVGSFFLSVRDVPVPKLLKISVHLISKF